MVRWPLMNLQDLTPDQLADLAERVDSSLKTLQHYASGRRQPSAARAIELERAAKKMKLDLKRESMCDACRGCDLAKKARKL